MDIICTKIASAHVVWYSGPRKAYKMHNKQCVECYQVPEYKQYLLPRTEWSSQHHSVQRIYEIQHAC